MEIQNGGRNDMCSNVNMGILIMRINSYLKCTGRKISKKIERW